MYTCMYVCLCEYVYVYIMYANTYRNAAAVILNQRLRYHQDILAKLFLIAVTTRARGHRNACLGATNHFGLDHGKTTQVVELQWAQGASVSENRSRNSMAEHGPVYCL